jgi:hypothetical protein
MGRGRKLTNSGLVLAAVAFSTAPSFAQNAAIPFTGNLSFVTGLDVDSNKNLDAVSPGTAVTVFEGIFYSMHAETASQIFEFSVGTRLEFENISGVGSNTRFTEPSIKFLYSNTSANSFFSIDGDYWKGDISSAYDVDPSNATLIRVDDGTLIRTATNLAFQTGINDPLGFFFDASYDTRGYTGTRDPSLRDSTTYDIGVGATFRFSQVTQGTFSVGRIDFEEQNNFGRQVVTDDVSFRLSHELGNGLTLNGDLSYEERETSNRLASVTESGVFAGIDFVQDRPNGTVFGGLNYDGTRFFDKTSVSLGRSLDLPDGNLSASLTLTDTDGFGLEYYWYINYLKQTSSGDFTIDISRRLTTDQNFRDIIFSKVGVGYQRQINSASDLYLSLDLSRKQGELVALVPTEDRATFIAAYSRAVTLEWFMNVGYRHREYTSNRRPDANSDSVFLTMTRDIQFGF